MREIKEYLAASLASISHTWVSSKNHLLDPAKLSRHSHVKAWWRCTSCSGEFETSIRLVTVRNYGCPYCSGSKVLKGFNDLATTHPELAQEWASLEILPTEVSRGSSRMIVWRCSENHSFRNSVKNRTGQKQNCPYCAGNKVLAGFNDVATTHPALALRWAPENKLKPTEVSFGSSKKIALKCLREKDHRATVASVANHSAGASCSQCLLSVGASQLLTVLEELTSEKIIINDRACIGPYELDFYLPTLAMAFEYNSVYWHSDEQLLKRVKLKSSDYHAMKTELAFKSGVKLFHIDEEEWQNLSHSDRKALVAEKLKTA